MGLHVNPRLFDVSPIKKLPFIDFWGGGRLTSALRKNEFLPMYPRCRRLAPTYFTFVQKACGQRGRFTISGHKGKCTFARIIFFETMPQMLDMSRNDL